MSRQQLELSDKTWLELGDRVVIHPGLISQRCGEVVEFRHMSGREGLYPVVLFDDGVRAFASYEWGLRKMQPVEQLSLFV